MGRRGCQSRALIDDSHALWSKLTAIRAEADTKAQATDLLAQAKQVTAMGDFEGAKAKHDEAEELDASHPDIAAVKQAHSVKQQKVTAATGAVRATQEKKVAEEAAKSAKRAAKQLESQEQVDAKKARSTGSQASQGS